MRTHEQPKLPGMEMFPNPGRGLGYQAVPIYELSGVEAAIGELDPAFAVSLGIDGEPSSEEAMFGTADNEQVARLRRILSSGERGRWRQLVRPSQSALVALDALSARAPHLWEVSGLVRRHYLAAHNMLQPLSLPPLLLLGPPGTGKTWYLSRLADALGIPFRLYPMNASTLGDGL